MTTMTTSEDPTTADEEDEPATERDHATDADREHLDGVADGCGCTEVWDHLSEQREAEATSD